jgi:hypothetical protein
MEWRDAMIKMVNIVDGQSVANHVVTPESGDGSFQ